MVDFSYKFHELQVGIYLNWVDELLGNWHLCEWSFCRLELITHIEACSLLFTLMNWYLLQVKDAIFWSCRRRLLCGVFPWECKFWGTCQAHCQSVAASDTNELGLLQFYHLIMLITQPLCQDFCFTLLSCQLLSIFRLLRWDTNNNKPLEFSPHIFLSAAIQSWEVLHGDLQNILNGLESSRF